MNAPELLREAADVIGQRAASRDLPAERAMRRAVGAFNGLTGHTLTETQGWMFMAVLKLARATAGTFQRDDLLDGAAYLALALEAELTQPQNSAPPIAKPADDTFQGWHYADMVLAAAGLRKALQSHDAPCAPDQS